jgi:hypothetical protein
MHLASTSFENLFLTRPVGWMFGYYWSGSSENMAADMNEVASCEFSGLVWVLYGQILVLHGKVRSLFSRNVGSYALRTSLLSALSGWAMLVGRSVVLGLVNRRWAPCFFIQAVTWMVAYSLWSICINCCIASLEDFSQVTTILSK